MATIFHTHLHGDRDTKNDRLIHSDISNTEWHELLPQTPLYLLIPQDNQLLEEYKQGIELTKIMPTNSIGMNSHRDSFAISFDDSTLRERLEELTSIDSTDEVLADKYKLIDTSDFSLSKARLSLRKTKSIKNLIVPCLYRPFDHRFVIYHVDILDRPRLELNSNFVWRNNLGLVTTRQTRENFAALAVDRVCGQHKIVSVYDGSSIFPLYLYPNSESGQKKTIEEPHRPNFSSEFLDGITSKLGYTPTPEAIFYYIYAIFHSPTYRTRYAEFLKIDFPRVPLTSNDALFRQLVTYGEELVALHLMKSPKLDNLITQFVDKGGKQTVDSGHPKYSNGKVTINRKGDGFTGVPEEVWNFYVGGYPVCAKWLKDRKGRTLSDEDIAHYQRIVVALQETINLMAAIDQAIPGFPIE